MEYTPEERNFLVTTACKLIRRRIEGATVPMQVTPFNAAVMKPAGCFTSLHSRQGHAMRGCVGRVDTAVPLLEALINAAWQTAADPRFANNPVRLAELPLLTLEISVIGPLKPAPGPLEFNPQVDGLFLQIAARSGVFLPQVARETGWTREQLLDRMCQEKLSLPPRSWRDPAARLFTFPSLIIGPTDFILD